MHLSKKGWFIVLITLILLLAIAGVSYAQWQKTHNLQDQLQTTAASLDQLKNEDQYVRNESLQTEIGNLQTVFNRSVTLYEAVIDLRDQGEDVTDLEKQFATVLRNIGNRDYDTAVASADTLQRSVDSINEAIAKKAQEAADALAKQQAEEAAKKAAATAQVTPTPTPVIDQSLPGDGQYKQVAVTAAGRQIVISMVAGNMSTTKVVIDTATNGTCATDCPVLPLGSYVERSGAFAGVNGTYFCPATYPQCSGSTNAFGLVVMNKEKTYINEADKTQAYPAAIFSSGGIQFISDVANWSNSTAIDGLISNYPLLVSNGQNVFAGSSDPKLTSRSNRSFVGNVGNMAYIGTVLSVTVAESAEALQAAGMNNALNLDAGGSTALWYGEYKLGPGRSLPNVVLFIRR